MRRLLTPLWYSGLAIGGVAQALLAQQRLSNGPAVPAPRSAAAAASAPASALALQDVTVIDVTDGRLHPRQTVVVVGNRIRAIGPTRKVRVPAGARVIAAHGKYVIPGLWEMHIHVDSAPQLAYNLLIANGVTGMREMGTVMPLAEQRRERDEILAGTRVGPRMLVTGGFVEMAEHNSGYQKILIRTPADAQRVVDSLQAAGADHIKLHDGAISRNIFFALAAEARRIGLRIIGHLPDVTVEEASDSGMRTIEHNEGWVGTCITRWWGAPPPASDSASLARCATLAARLRRNGTWNAADPGTWPRRVTGDSLRARLRYWPRKFWPDTGDFARLDKQRAKLLPEVVPPDVAALAQCAGLPLIVVGHVESPTVAGFLPGFGVHDAIALYVEQGLTPLTALQSVTLNPAKYLDGTDSLGTVAAGKLADLVLLDANPLEDIYNTQKIRAVIANGRYFDRAALDELLVQTGKVE